MSINRAKIEKNAEKYLRQGKIDAAIAEYQQIVQAEPKDVNTINKIGDLYARHGKPREAIAQFSKIAEFYSSDGFLLKAIAIYKKINKLDPSYMEAYQQLADLYSQQGLVMEAKSQYQTVAEHYLKAGQLEKTRQVFDKLLKLAPDDLKTRLSLAELCAKEKKIDLAIKEYLGVAQELDKRDMLKESVRIYQTALKLQPGNREVLDRLTRVLSQQGEHDQVIELLKGQITARREPGIMALLAQAYLGKDRLAEAKKLLEEAARIDSDAVEIRVALGRLQLKQGEVGQAFHSLSDAAGRLEKEGKANEAAHLWEEFVRAQPEHIEALAQLEAVHRRGEHLAKANAVASDLADLLIAEQRMDDARQVLERLVASDAGNPRHRERLESLKRAPAPAPKKVTAPARRQAPALEIEPEAELELAVPQPPRARPAGGARPSAAASPAALEPLPESTEEEDKDFVSERVTEAEVFVKYGLVDKALEQLQGVLSRFPRSLTARQKLREMYQENGDTDAAVRECVQIARIHRDRGESAEASQILEEASGLGASPGVQALVDQALGGEAPAAAAPESEPILEPVLEVAEESVPDLALELTPDEPAPAPAAPAMDLELDLQPEEALIEVSPAAAPEEPGESLEIEIESGSDAEPSAEELKEVDFYLDQGLEDEARTLLDKLQARAPGSEEIRRRTGRLGGRRPAAVPLAKPVSTGNILAEIELELSESGQPAAAGAGGGEFFDLASDLDESLFGTQTAVEGSTGQEPESDEHSLDEIFKAFKKGVEQQVDAADYETHYNLGIAYKEMGLIEEAIGEFQIAAKDPRRLLQCCSMLGLCFKEKGMTNLALKWYQRGLESPQHADEGYQGLKYDLAGLYMEMGDYAKAMEIFTDVYGANAKYRDVSLKIKELERLIVHGK